MSKTKNTTLSIANKTNTAPTNGRPVSAMMQSQPKGDIATQPITGAMPAVGGDDAATKNQRPDFLPEKFWDEEHQQVRLAELSKSYSALEKQFGKNRSDLQKLEKLQAEKNTLEENQARLQADLETATLFGKIGRGTG
ncbi:MAG: hypothetical protein ORN57_05255, partial [Alphaproteobacteria bacterium]|nr:hypothetical protein [Alphaproteobacteria bacterium]